MVQVVLWGSLKRAAQGKSQVEVEAADLKQLLTRLGEAYPDLKPQIERGVSVSIDGLIYTNNWFQPIRPGAEVVLLPKLAGG
jgi:molybdopterin converting factor small subunit